MADGAGPRWPWMPARIAQSIFPTTVTVAGDLDSDDPIRIDGMLEGKVRGTDVTVSRKASVRGAILADTVRIEGRVDGHVEAASVLVTRRARLTGEVRCATLEVEEGAHFAARCRVWAEEEEDGAAPAAESVARSGTAAPA